jgi:hypothetical protein
MKLVKGGGDKLVCKCSFKKEVGTPPIIQRAVRRRRRSSLMGRVNDAITISFDTYGRAR